MRHLNGASPTAPSWCLPRAAARHRHRQRSTPRLQPARDPQTSVEIRSWESPTNKSRILFRFTAQDRIRKTLALGHADTVMVSLTTTEGSKPRRPHQAFLLLKEPSGLEAPFPLTVKDSGKGVVEFVSLPIRDCRHAHQRSMLTWPASAVTAKPPLPAARRLVPGSEPCDRLLWLFQRRCDALVRHRGSAEPERAGAEL